MFDEREEDLIRAWNDGLDSDVCVRVLQTDDPRSGRVETFAGRFAALAPRVRLASEREPGSAAPAIQVTSRLRYLAVPAGTELVPFLECVGRFAPRVAEHTVVVSGPAAGRGGAEARLFVTPHCPHCPVAATTLFGLLDEDPAARLAIVDVDLFPEIATRDHVRSVPTVLVGRHYRSTGAVSIPDVRAALTGQRPDAEALGRMLDSGDADVVAAMMIEAGEVFPGVLNRLAHETMSVRLGAMAALERVIASAPDAARAAEPGIWERLAGTGPQATGDLVYILGEAGGSDSVPRLQAFLQDSADDELREAVEDALARLAERGHVHPADTDTRSA